MNQDQYEITIRAFVYAKDGRATFSRTCTLPIPPFPELMITLNDEDNDFIKVKHVECITEYNEIRVTGVLSELDDCPCELDDDDCCMLDINYWTNLGWTLESKLIFKQRRKTKWRG